MPRPLKRLTNTLGYTFSATEKLAQSLDVAATVALRSAQSYEARSAQRASIQALEFEIELEESKAAVEQRRKLLTTT